MVENSAATAGITAFSSLPQAMILGMKTPDTMLRADMNVVWTHSMPLLDTRQPSTSCCRVRLRLEPPVGFTQGQNGWEQLRQSSRCTRDIKTSATEMGPLHGKVRGPRPRPVWLVNMRQGACQAESIVRKEASTGIRECSKAGHRPRQAKESPVGARDEAPSAGLRAAVPC